MLEQGEQRHQVEPGEEADQDDAGDQRVDVGQGEGRHRAGKVGGGYRRVKAAVKPDAPDRDRRGIGGRTRGGAGRRGLVEGHRAGSRFLESFGSRRVTGDPLSFVLAATGRADPAVLGLDPTVNVYA